MTTSVLLGMALLTMMATAATLASLSASRRLYHGDGQDAERLRLAFGVGAAPFVLGLASVLALSVLPGASHQQHLALMILVLILVFGIGLGTGKPVLPSLPKEPDPISKTERMILRVIRAALFLWGVSLIGNTLLIPLTQNDSLEYALVGRELFFSRAISIYPVMNPDTNATGFFGPWTHPPLYVGLIYLANVLQGQANDPGVMRLLSPWFLSANLFVVYHLGLVFGRLAAGFSALIMLSVPLYFLGATSALLDALPSLGMSLVLVALLHPQKQSAPIRQGIVLGLAIALGLWAHSQSILLIPLALLGLLLASGPRDFFSRANAVRLAVTGAVVVAVASWPYMRNIGIFGAMISDNPLIFSLDVLDWAGYFAQSRSLSSVPEVVQYGIFKGWFAYEAFGFSFWFMLIGLFYSLARLMRRDALSSWIAGEFSSEADRTMLLWLGLIVIYLGGVVLSSLAGIDLMIRNERYMLIILPMAALIGGTGLAALTQRLSFQPAGQSGSVAHLGGVVVLSAFFATGLLQFMAVGGFRLFTLKVDVKSVFVPERERLRPVAMMEPIFHLNTSTPRDALILSMKPADMFYAERRMLSYLDPRLVPFYRASSVENALAELNKLGVTHVHMPDYALPPVYNSFLQSILARSDLSQLTYANGGHQLYALRMPNEPSASPGISARQDSQFRVLALDDWSETRQLVLGGRRMISRIALWTRPLADDLQSQGARFWLFRRDVSTLLMSGGRFHPGSSLAGATPVEGRREYLLSLQLEGEAFARVSVAQIAADGKASLETLGDMPLSGGAPARGFQRRFLARADSVAVRVVIEYVGAGHLKIKDAQLFTQP